MRPSSDSGRDRPGVVEDAVAHLEREVQPAAVALEHVDDAQRVLVVAEAALEALAQRAVERASPACPKGGWPRSWPSPMASVRSSLRRSARATVREMPDGLERVREPRAVVIALGGDEDLRLVLEAPERLAVGDAVAIALERAAQPARRLGDEPAARLRRADCERRQPARLLGVEARQEGVGDRSSGSHAPGRFYLNLPSRPGRRWRRFQDSWGGLMRSPA